MSDDANELFSESPDGNAGERADGAHDAMEPLGTDEGGNAPVTQIGDVDVSVFDAGFREFLSGLDPEVAAQVASEQRRHFDDMKRNQTKKHQEIAEERKRLGEMAQYAAFGQQIADNPELMARVMAVGGADGGQQSSEPLPAIGDIDFSTPEGEGELARAIISNPAAQAELKALVEKIAKETASQTFNSNPVMQRQMLRTAAESVRRDHASGLSNDQWSAITSQWVAGKGGESQALGVDPQTAYSELSMLAQVAQGFIPKNDPRPTRTTGAPSPSGAPSAPLSKTAPWEREGRKMTNREIMDHGGGTSPGDLERAFERMKKKGSFFA